MSAWRISAASLAVLLLALGVSFAVLYRITDNAEHHSFNAGAKAPDSVHVTAGKQYEISTPGGVKRLAGNGIAGGAVTCTYSTLDGSEGGQLTVAPLGVDTRTVHAIATFVAPITAQVRIKCSGMSGVFVDDSDDAAADPAGLFILLTTIALAAGAALAMSVLYRRPPRNPATSPATSPATAPPTFRPNPPTTTQGDHGHIDTDW